MSGGQQYYKFAETPSFLSAAYPGVQTPLTGALQMVDEAMDDDKGLGFGNGRLGEIRRLGKSPPGRQRRRGWAVTVCFLSALSCISLFLPAATSTDGERMINRMPVKIRSTSWKEGGGEGASCFRFHASRRSYVYIVRVLARAPQFSVLSLSLFPSMNILFKVRTTFGSSPRSITWPEKGAAGIVVSVGDKLVQITAFNGVMMF